MDERVEIPVQNGLGIANLVAGAAVFDKLVGVEDVAADRFAAKTGIGRGGSASAVAVEIWGL